MTWIRNQNYVFRRNVTTHPFPNSDGGLKTPLELGDERLLTLYYIDIITYPYHYLDVGLANPCQ